MAAVGLGMCVVGAMLIYAGMTGESVVGAIRKVLSGEADSAPVDQTPTAPATGGGGGRLDQVK